MRRRAFLATAATALPIALAGCAHPTDGSLSMGAVENNSAIADRYAGSADGLSPELQDLVAATIDGREPRTEGTTPELESPRPVEYEGAYYQITHEVVGSRLAMRYDVRVDYDPESQPDRVIAYPDLPAADTEALDGLIPPAERRDRTSDGFDIGRGYTYPEDAESVLRDGEYGGVSYEGTTYGVNVEEGREVTVNTYVYHAEQVAESASELGQQLRERYHFTLSGLSGAERDIVEQAIEGTYFPDSDVPDAFRSLSDRFRVHDGIVVDEYSGTWLAEYDGTMYWADLQYPPETDA